jgi:hypothetical protein
LTNTTNLENIEADPSNNETRLEKIDEAPCSRCRIYKTIHCCPNASTNPHPSPSHGKRKNTFRCSRASFVWPTCTAVLINYLPYKYALADTTDEKEVGAHAVRSDSQKGNMFSFLPFRSQLNLLAAITILLTACSVLGGPPDHIVQQMFDNRVQVVKKNNAN